VPGDVRVGPVQVGVVFPQTEIGSDPVVIRAWAAAVEELGYAHMLTYEHVLGADPAGHPGFAGPYDIASAFHEPFVLFGYLAAVTNLDLVTGVVILPQRQTALVAKQAAEVDLLTEGRLRLGIGLGWNAVEYEALGRDFTNRGRRVSEQVALLRLLWTESSVTFRGRYETVTAAGLAPLPVQRPIPIWFGAHSPPALRRAGRLADGWFPYGRPGPRLDEQIELVHRAAEAAGRDPGRLGMEGRVGLSRGVDEAASQVRAWEASGATHVAVNTMGLGSGGVDRHLAALAEVAHAVGLPPRKIG
jgi:probable F420-dependent oxidoreductase